MHLVSHINSLQVNTLPISCTWHHTSTVSSVTPCLRLCAWGHVATVSNVTPLFYLGSHVHRFQGDTPSGPCSWSYMSTVSSITPYHQTLYLSLLGLTLQGDPVSQTLYLGSHIHSLQSDSSKILYLRLHVYSLQGFPTLKSLYLGSHIQSPG